MAIYRSIDHHELDRVLDRGVDHGGNPVEPFVDDDPWPLRCCLADSRPGERIAIVAWSPMPWTGPYAETGPIVVHADGCASPEATDVLPAELDRRPMVLRPYGHDRRIAYHRVVYVPAGESVAAHVESVLAHDDVEIVHARNVTGGCFAFSAKRT